jgi:RHS repeat-associated protein
LYTETATKTATTIYSLGLTYKPNGDVDTGNDSVNGNWTYGYDAFNRLLNATATGQAYTYDAENRIVTASNMTNGPYCYAYDADGLRMMKSHASGGSCTGTVTVDMMYWRNIAGNTIAETDSNGSTSNAAYNEYVFFASRRIAQSNPYMNNVYYYFVDHLGSTRAVTDKSGNLCYEVDYLPYGTENTPANFTGSCSSPPPFRYRFTGYERDAETAYGNSSGNDYAFARYYNTRLGRFMSADPLDGDITDPQTLNRYAYVRDNPSNRTDPSGMEGGGPPSACDQIGFCGPPASAPCAIFRQVCGPNRKPGPPAKKPPKVWPQNQQLCISTESLNWLQQAQLTAAQTYAYLTGWTFGFGAGLDAGAGVGSKRSSWNFGLGGSASTLIVADASGNSGFLNTVSGGFSAVKTSSAGSWWGAGAAAGPSVLVSPFSINRIAGPSGSISAGGGAVLGAGATITTSGAATFTFGVGAGAEAGVSPQFGTSQFIPFCHN